jgi:hypothetical protein
MILSFDLWFSFGGFGFDVFLFETIDDLSVNEFNWQVKLGKHDWGTGDRDP